MDRIDSVFKNSVRTVFPNLSHLHVSHFHTCRIEVLFAHRMERHRAQNPEQGCVSRGQVVRSWSTFLVGMYELERLDGAVDAFAGDRAWQVLRNEGHSRYISYNGWSAHTHRYISTQKSIRTSKRRRMQMDSNICHLQMKNADTRRYIYPHRRATYMTHNDNLLI